MDEQLRQAFEEVTTNNVKTVIDFSKKTRSMISSLEERVERLQNIVLSRDEQIKQMQLQIAQLLQVKYNNGT